MRNLNERMWSDGTRHWYDGMMGGYYVDEGVPGLFVDDGSRVQDFEDVTVQSQREFSALITGIILARPGLIP